MEWLSTRRFNNRRFVFYRRSPTSRLYRPRSFLRLVLLFPKFEIYCRALLEFNGAVVDFVPHPSSRLLARDFRLGRVGFKPRFLTLKVLLNILGCFGTVVIHLNELQKEKNEFAFNPDVFFFLIQQFFKSHTTEKVYFRIPLQISMVFYTFHKKITLVSSCTEEEKYIGYGVKVFGTDK